MPAESLVVQGLERWLIDYFESNVAHGVRFEAGQKVDLGGSLLRLFDRGDGTLGVRDVAADGKDATPESVHRSLMRAWLRQQVAASYGLLASVPATSSTAILCSRVDTSTHALLLKRMRPTPNTLDSGWFIGCTDSSHDHDATYNLQVIYLAAASERFPWLDPFFSLPLRTDLIVEMEDGRPRVAVLWHGDGDEPIQPLAGTYVAALNAAASGRS